VAITTSSHVFELSIFFAIVDREFYEELIKEIEFEEEVKMMSKNISEFKNCYSPRYGRPDYSAPLPPGKVPGSVRKYLILTGKYEKVPRNLRAKLDNYYKECEEYDSIIDKEGSSVKVKEKQQRLENPENLLSELKDRIRDPNPLL